jgi:hypothetical protein
MTNAGWAGIVLEYRFRDLFCFHIRLAELFGTEMPRLIERLKVFHGEIISVSEPRFARRDR